MKKLKLTCLKCDSSNVRQENREDIHFFDIDTCAMLNPQYYTVNCVCNDCNYNFKIRVVRDIRNTEINYYTYQIK